MHPRGPRGHLPPPVVRTSAFEELGPVHTRPPDYLERCSNTELLAELEAGKRGLLHAMQRREAGVARATPMGSSRVDDCGLLALKRTTAIDTTSRFDTTDYTPNWQIIYLPNSGRTVLKLARAPPPPEQQGGP